MHTHNHRKTFSCNFVPIVLLHYFCDINLSSMSTWWNIPCSLSHSEKTAYQKKTWCLAGHFTRYCNSQDSRWIHVVGIQPTSIEDMNIKSLSMSTCHCVTLYPRLGIACLVNTGFNKVGIQVQSRAHITISVIYIHNQTLLSLRLYYQTTRPI